MDEGASRRRWMIPSLVAAATLAAFLPALGNKFVNWDDLANLTANPHYRGLGWTNLKWMFTTLHLGPYQPLCWLSFAADYLIWGLNPAGYHLTNLLLHAANAVLFYAISARLLSLAAGAAPDDGQECLRRWTAGLAALLFAIHPLRVESVAWVMGRKDVLSGFFYLCAVYAYLRRHADSSSSGQGWQALCWGTFALALLSRSLTVTLPAAFIILDIYPLRRLPGQARQWFSGAYRRVWLEKLAFLVLVLPITAAGYLGQRQAGAVFSEGFAAHCAKALFRLAFYVWKTLWPWNLCPYESPVSFNPYAWPCLLSATAVATITLAAFLSRRRWPAGLAAWSFYALTLAPVLGLVSFGAQLVADRYSYLACLPWPLLAAAGGLGLWRRAGPRRRKALGLGTGLLIAALMALTLRQTAVWHDSETLWRHVLSIRPRTGFAHNDLGLVLAQQGRYDEAVTHYREAVTINPADAYAHTNWANTLCGLGRPQEALDHYRLALSIDPGFAPAHYNLGSLLAQHGRLEAAIPELRRAVELAPDLSEAWNSLGVSLADAGRLDEAVAAYGRATRLDASAPDAWNNQCNAMQRLGRWAESEGLCREALRLKPAFAQAHYNLGNTLYMQGRLAEAASHFSQAITLLPGFSEAYNSLGVVLRRAGRWPEAAEQYRKAVAADSKNDQARRNLNQALSVLRRRRAPR